MANKELSALTEASTADTGDTAFLDVGGNSRRIRVGNLLKSLAQVGASDTGPNPSDILNLYEAAASALGRITLQNLWKVIDQFTGDTGPNTGDEIALYQAADTVAGKLTLLNLFRAPHQFDADTGPNLTDEVTVYEAAGDAARRMTLTSLFGGINQLTTDTGPDETADFLLLYSAAAAAARKILPSALMTNPAITGAILEDIFTITDGAAFEVDPGNGSIQRITLGAARTPKATNFTNGQSVTLEVDDGSAYTLTWTDATWGGSGVVWVGGSAPTLATSGWTVIELWKIGGQVYGATPGSHAA